VALILSAPLPFDGPVLAERISSTDWSAFLTATDQAIEGLDFAFDVELHGPDPMMVDEFLAAADPVRPTVDRNELERMAAHRAIARVVSEEPVGADATLATAQRAQLVAVALIDAGALGVRIDNAMLAHGRTRWRELLALTRDAIQRQRMGESEATPDFFSGLLRTFVRRPVHTGDHWHTRGLHLLARPEVGVVADQVDGVSGAREVLDAFMLHQTAHAHPLELHDGMQWRIDEDSPMWEMTRQPDPWNPEASLAHNVHGFWQLTRLE
jgi:hypothetical protein